MNEMTFREAVDIRIAQLQGRPVDAGRLAAAIRTIEAKSKSSRRIAEPVQAAAVVLERGRVTLAPILVVDFYRGAA